jgi:hypothetical protein
MTKEKNIFVYFIFYLGDFGFEDQDQTSGLENAEESDQVWAGLVARVIISQ